MQLLTLACAFALGSLLGGQIMGWLKGVDLRQSGSGNLGATNALRSQGLLSGIAVLLFDAGKAILAVFIAHQLEATDDSWLPWAAAAMVILGHIYSPWAGFKGGKGVACGLGACLYLLPWGLLWGAAGFVSCLLLSGYVSLSVLLASSLILFYVTCISSSGIWSAAGAFSLFLLLIIIWAHRENWRRLLRGEESRFEKVMLIKPQP